MTTLLPAETTRLPQGNQAEPLDDIPDLDRPLRVLFTPLELQELLTNAYLWQGRARLDLHGAIRASEARKRELRHKQQVLRMGADYALLKNAEERETYLAVECAELNATCEAAEDELGKARLEYDNATSEVEHARALLRVAELAIYQVVPLEATLIEHEGASVADLKASLKELIGQLIKAG
jgi:hypothetical protein